MSKFCLLHICSCLILDFKSKLLTFPSDLMNSLKSAKEFLEIFKYAEAAKPATKLNKEDQYQ